MLRRYGPLLGFLSLLVVIVIKLINRGGAADRSPGVRRHGVRAGAPGRGLAAGRPRARGERTPGRLGLIGGHVEADAPAAGVLEETGRREVAEEVGLDLTGVPLTYLESEYFVTEGASAR